MLLILQSSICEWVMRELRLTQMSLWMSDGGLIESLPQWRRTFEAERVCIFLISASRKHRSFWHLENGKEKNKVRTGKHAPTERTRSHRRRHSVYQCGTTCKFKHWDVTDVRLRRVWDRFAEILLKYGCLLVWKCGLGVKSRKKIICRLMDEKNNQSATGFRITSKLS